MSAEIPVPLQLLLTQEAYLIRSKERLSAGRLGLKEQLEERNAQKTGFSLSKKARQEKSERDTAIGELKEALTVLDKASTYADKVLGQLRPQIESQLEDLLRFTSDEYRRGLSAQKLQSDIIRCLKRFRDRVAQMKKSVGMARNMMAGCYDSTNKSYRESALLDLEIAAKAGRDLEEEIDFFNQIADEHSEVVDNSSFENVSLPRLRDFPYETFVRTQADFPASDLKVNFDKIITECDDLLSTGITALFKQIGKANEAHQSASVSFVHNYWKIMRDYACQSWVDPEQLDDFLEKLEDGMLEKPPAA